MAHWRNEVELPLSDTAGSTMVLAGTNIVFQSVNRLGEAGPNYSTYES